eukprot:m.117551 g.117551  ORF g.117551 m.117551 type:complete len:206 (+) comp28585_c0_seq1:145-762(+)
MNYIAYRTAINPISAKLLKMKKTTKVQGDWFDHCTDTASLSAFFRTWDKATENTRRRILAAFLTKFQNATESELETALFNGASLFLTRLSAWLRLTYLLANSNVDVKIQAIHVFMKAAGGTRFQVEFMEIGGALTLLEMLKIPSISELAKVNIIECLLTIANSGTHFKEILVESKAQEYLETCTSSAGCEELEHATNELLKALSE